MEKALHQVWVGPYRVPAREQGFIEQMKRTHPGFTHTLWTDRAVPALPDFLQERYDWRMSLADYAFAADILRVFVIWSVGGIYLDVDTETLEGLAAVEVGAIKGVFRHHGDNDLTFSNDFMGLERNHPLGEYLLSTMKSPAYDFGPHWLGKTVRAYVGLPVFAGHAAVRQALEQRGILYLPSGETEAEGTGLRPWNRMFRNRSLFSWSDENRAKFKRGDYV